MTLQTLVSVIGARPQFIKVAPVVRAVPEGFRHILLHTGQHYDAAMSAVFFQELGIPPADLNLGVGSGSHAEQTGRMMIELERALAGIVSGRILLYGDTNSTLAGALVAAKMHIPIAHVEAGLRSYDRSMPEEVNRVVCDHLSSQLFCPTETAVANLNAEGIREGIHRVGDVMYDALIYHLSRAGERSKALARFGLNRRGYALATIHRATNTDDPERMRSILEGFACLDSRILFPVHPRTRDRLSRSGLALPPNVIPVEPLGYLDMLVLEQNASCIFTDSGGIQKEAFWLGVRCVTLREETEWVETVSSGWNRLVGVDPSAMKAAFEGWFPSGGRPVCYGDGHAAEKMMEVLSAIL